MIQILIHEEFVQLRKDDLEQLFGEGKKVLLDIKGLLDRKEYEDLGYCYWRL